MEQLVILALTTLGSAFLGSYLAGYLRKKGENLATSEDIGKLTTATKEIEARISGDVWDRQKRWELKRDVLFETTKRLTELDNALLFYGGALKVDEKDRLGNWSQMFHERSKRESDALQAYDETKHLVAIVCKEETSKAVSSFAILVSRVAVAINEKEADAYDKAHAELCQKLLAVRAAIRKELEIDRPA
jgi:hypothetical protein